MYKNNSLLDNQWLLKDIDERKVLYISQKFNLSIFLSKIIASLDLDEEKISSFLKPDILNIIPNPFKLKDMEKSVLRTIEAIRNNEKIGILADYDVDGSTSAAILYKFLNYSNLNISIKIPNRLTEGYGPNIRIMDEFLNEKIKLLFTLDCGTSSFEVLNKSKYSEMDTIVIDHHISEIKFPKIFSIINPNRFDENNNFKTLSAVGVTYLFLIALRKIMRKENFFKNINEPNLLSYLDLVALGTVCDVVPLDDLNRAIVKKGLDIIRSRKSKVLTTILDNSNVRSSPKSDDLGFTIGPQINAASRLGFSSLPTQMLISKDENEINIISRKLNLLNEKRKLIEDKIYDDATKQVINNSKYIMVYSDNWHLGVLGIIASRLNQKYSKPTIVISFEKEFGTGSARSIDKINLGNFIMNAKNNGLLISGGGHNKAAGFKIHKNKLNSFKTFLESYFLNYEDKIFIKKYSFIDKISINQINLSLLEDIKKLEPNGNGNENPLFIFTDINIESIKIIKEKHLLVFFTNDFNKLIKGYFFNAFDSTIYDYLKNFKKFKFEIGGILKEDNYYGKNEPQIIIKDIMLLN